MMDTDDNWDMLAEDYGDSGAPMDDGWGVDSNLYTTQLDTAVSSDLQQRAAAMARQIRAARSQNRFDQSNHNRRMVQEYRQAQRDEFRAAPMNNAALQITSSEDALLFLRQQQQQQQQQQRPGPQGRRPPQPPRQGAAQPRQARTAPRKMSTPADERAAQDFSQKQLILVRNLLRTHGTPTPVQCGKFLKRLTAGVVGKLRFPQPDVRTAVSALFRKCCWEIRANRSVVGSSPPTGAQLLALLQGLVKYFAQRLGGNNNGRRQQNGRQQNGRQQQRRNGNGRQQQQRRQQQNGRQQQQQQRRHANGSQVTKKQQEQWQQQRRGKTQAQRQQNGRRQQQQRMGQKNGMNTNRSGGGQSRNRRRGGARGSGGRDSGRQRSQQQGQQQRSR